MIKVPKELVKDIINYIDDRLYCSPKSNELQYIYDSLVERYNENKNIGNEEKTADLKDEIDELKEKIEKLEKENKYVWRNFI